MCLLVKLSPVLLSSKLNISLELTFIRGVTIQDATIRYVSRYKPHDTVYDTIHKTRYRLQQLRHLNKALAPQNEKTKTEYIKKNSTGVLIILCLF